MSAVVSDVLCLSLPINESGAQRESLFHFKLFFSPVMSISWLVEA
jgi:hypothetical protein